MASQSDPTGMQAALATIPKGQLSERQQRIAAGLYEIRAGSSINAASKAVGIPYATLYKHHKGLISSDNEKTLTKGEGALIDGLFAIAGLASEKIFERLEDTKHPMSDGNLIKAQGVATDKIAAFRNWSKGQGSKGVDQGISILAQLMQGKRVTIGIEDTDPVEEAIDVTGERTE